MPEVPPLGEVFVPFADLGPVHGIPYTRQYVRQLVARGEFPRPRRLSANRIAWRLSDINAWKDTRPLAGPKRPRLKH